MTAQMQTLAAERGWSGFAGLQAEYSLVQREAERELIPMARGLGLGFPHDFLASAEFIFGGLSGQLDLPPGRPARG